MLTPSRYSMQCEPIPDWLKPCLTFSQYADLFIAKAYQVWECGNIFFSNCQKLHLSCCRWSNNGTSNSSVLVKRHGKSWDNYCRFWGKFLSKNLETSIYNFPAIVDWFYFFINYCFYNLKASLGCNGKVAPLWPKVTGSSRGNSLSAKSRGKAAYNKRPSPNPRKAGSLGTGVCPLFKLKDQMLVTWELIKVKT